MSAHTPGPWRDVSSRGLKRSAAAAMVATGSGTNRAIAIDCTRSGANEAEDFANARLIAAAPELLDALIDVVDAYTQRFGQGSKQLFGPIDTEIVAARAAIAKATGNKP